MALQTVAAVDARHRGRPFTRVNADQKLILSNMCRHPNYTPGANCSHMAEFSAWCILMTIGNSTDASSKANHSAFSLGAFDRSALRNSRSVSTVLQRCSLQRICSFWVQSAGDLFSLSHILCAHHRTYCLVHATIPFAYVYLNSYPNIAIVAEWQV